MAWQFERCRCAVGMDDSVEGGEFFFVIGQSWGWAWGGLRSSLLGFSGADRFHYRATENRYSACMNPGKMSAITPRLGICIGWERLASGSVAGPLLDRIIRDQKTSDTNFAGAVAPLSTTGPRSVAGRVCPGWVAGLICRFFMFQARLWPL